MRYFLHLAYDGTNYSGWQVQPNSVTVQEIVNKSLHKLLQHRISGYGCGRTDTGVHAKDFYMHFDTEKELADLHDFLFRLNCVLPDDIAVFRIFPVEQRQHARYHATERTYEYFIHFQKNPMLRHYSLFQGFYKIDWEKVFEATEFLKTVEDFTALCLKSEDFKTNICLIKEARWDLLHAHHFVLKHFDTPTLDQPLDKHNTSIEIGTTSSMRFTITSNRFLRGMVRRIVGTLLMIGKNKISMEEFKTRVMNKEQFRVQISAPAHGLYLAKVRYPFVDGSSGSLASHSST